MIKLQKEYTREHSLFYIYTWYYSNYVRSHKMVGDGVKTSLYIFEPNNENICTAWYDFDDISRIMQKINELSKKPGFVDWIEKEFYKFWNKIKPYLEQGKKIESMKELTQIYDNSIAFFFQESVVILAPNIINFHQKDKERFIKLREIVQEKVNDIDDVFLEFFIRNYPEYKDVSHYILPEEVFSLEKEELSKNKLNEIRERKEKGCLLLNGKLYLYPKLNEILDKNNLDLIDYKINKKIFTKEHSREYSLFRLASWYNIMNKWLRNKIGKGVEEACAVYKGGDLVSIYYEPNELKQVFGSVLEKCKDKEYIKDLINEFLDLFLELKEYYVGNKKIESVKDLKKLYKKYSFVWGYTAVIFIIPLFDVDSGLKELAEEAREQTQEYNESIENIFKKALERFFPKLKGKTRFILPDEVWNNKIKDKNYIEILKQREKGYVFYKNKIYTEDLKKNLENLNIELEDKKSVISGDVEINENEIKGQPAFKGKVRGKVKVVMSFKEVTKVKKGDVLVTAMTMPKYLPAMKKAAAFITDEGGVTCHAAIVSRELKKPCIVGTKIATKVLKDNDLVEVDAENGVVRKLK